MENGIYNYNPIIKKEHIDINGHVNNVHYITWMQEAAIAHSKANGLEYKDYRDMQAVWLVGSHTIDYKRAIVEGDEIFVKTWVYQFGKKDALRIYHFLRGDKVVAKAQTRWVYVDLLSGRPLLIPENVRNAFIEVDQEK